MLTINIWKITVKKGKKEEDAFSIPFPSNTAIATVKAWTYETEEEVKSFLPKLWQY